MLWHRVMVGVAVVVGVMVVMMASPTSWNGTQGKQGLGNGMQHSHAYAQASTRLYCSSTQ